MGSAMHRRLAAGLAASYALAAAGGALAGPPPRPIVSAPSQYVEVVPSAGGSVPAGSSSGRSRSAVETGPRSALGAAADAVASADRGGVLALAAALVAATAGLVATAIRRRRRSRPA
jgi:hypothetical protein